MFEIWSLYHVVSLTQLYCLKLAIKLQFTVYRGVDNRHATRTVFDLANVADVDVFDKYLDDFAVPYDAEALLALDLRLQTAKLPLLPPIVERRHQNDDDDGADYCRTLYPPGIRLGLIVASCDSQTTRLAAVYPINKRNKRTKSCCRR